MITADIMTSAPTSLMIFRLLILVFFCAGGARGAVEVYIGNGLFLPTTNLGTALNPLRSVFEGNISMFLHDEQYVVKVNEKRFMQSSERLYTSLGGTFGLNVPIKVLQLSFSTSFNTITGQQADVAASAVMVESYNRRVFLRNEATSMVQLPLRSEFLQELTALPEPPASGSITADSQWAPYDSFLRKWGSHYVSSIFYGTWLRQWSVASSSRHYTERQIEARACAKLMGTERLTSVGACASVTSEDMAESLRLQMHDTIEVRGGDASTASALATRRTEELVSRFIEEGTTSDHAVRYEFVAVWKPVLARYPFSTSKEWRVATALEAYYNGFLAFGCPYQQLNTPLTIMQQFRRIDNGMYQCVRQCQGCRRNGDCNLSSGGCYCYGNSCIAALAPDGRAIVQTQRDNLPRNQLPNRSCYYSFPSCRCDDISKEAQCGSDNLFVIWDQTADRVSLALQEAM